MAIPSGGRVFLVRSTPTKIQEALYFVARTVRSILINAFFYHRLDERVTSGSLKGVDYEEARYSSYALFDAIALDMGKLLEQRRDTWNLRQLYKEWIKYEKDPEKQRIVENAIGELDSTFEWLAEYRHEKAAHQSQQIEMTMLTVLPPTIRNLADVIDLLDLFVNGQIPYKLHLHEDGGEIDLRNTPGLFVS